MKAFLICSSLAAIFVLGARELPAQEPDFHRDIAPILDKYCVGCHEDSYAEGKLSLESYASLMNGGKRGTAVVAGHPELSRMVRVLTGEAKPAMPPKGEKAPPAEDIDKLIAWIKAGAKGPEGDPPPKVLITPEIEPRPDFPRSINDLKLLGNNQVLLARYGEIDLLNLSTHAVTNTPVGKADVNVLATSTEGPLIAAGGGVPGLRGEVHLWRIDSSGEQMVLADHRTWIGHSDTIYAIEFSPDGSLLATGGYDRTVKIWNVSDSKLLHTFTTHNDTVYDLAWHPHGRILASASADFTVKLWDAIDGRRLDTLGQSTKALYSVVFHPSGKWLSAAGEDNRIRVWSISDDAREGTNPLVYSRFAHEEPILRLAYSPDGRLLISAAEDRLVKAWDSASMRLRVLLSQLSDWPTSIAVDNESQNVMISLRDASMRSISLEQLGDFEADATPLPEIIPAVSYGPQPKIAELPRIEETEPNNGPGAATALEIPCVAKGVIDADSGTDVDLYRFAAKAGDRWVIETNAARSKSPLDSKLEVLHEDGSPVVRLLLRAVRDSELEFRGTTSAARGFRLKNWEEMLLNQFFYVGGDVMKHFQQRRGPDADAQMYPEGGSRYAYFDTTPRAHALEEPAYVVVPYPADAKLPDNGLPQIPLYFENDDESKQQMGKDSQLTFTAPADGNYLIAVSDVRGFAGQEFRYELIVRRPEPNYSVALDGANPTLNAGGGKGFKVRVNRQDGFEGAVEVAIADPPEGFYVTSPITIEPGLTEAFGVLYAAADATKPAEETGKQLTLAASATIDTEQVDHNGGDFGTLKLADKSKIRVFLEPIDSEPKQPPTTADGFPTPPVVEIAPGTTVTCRLRIERQDFDARVSFDVLNLPHGVIVDNIGLNGVLMPEGETERILYLTAEPWVADTDRLFHAVAKAEGDQASLPMLLRVRQSKD